MTKAVVSLLSKVDVPTEAVDGRPITILGTIYRIWAKCMTRKILAHLLPWLPERLFGFISGRSSLDMAWALQSAIEESLCSQSKLSGSTMDLTKAFMQLLAAHDAFLSSLTRFFCFDGALYCPTTSNIGVPEGCPISVVAMLLVTWIADARMKATLNVPLYSYVDNWSLQSNDPNVVLKATDNAAETIDRLAMTLSFDKLKFYSTDEGSRKKLKASQIQGHKLQVVHDFQDLGVFFCTVKRKSAKCFNTRFQKMQHRFQKLQVARWSDFRKAKSLSRVILPAVLYGAELTHFSASSFKSLCARCSSSLWGKSNQRDHYLAPLLAAADVYEPFLLVFSQRWRTLQRMLRRYHEDVLRRWNVVLGCVG